MPSLTESSYSRLLPSGRATLIGQLSLVIWALSACATSYLKNIPAFEILLVLFFSGFVTSSIVNTACNTWKNLFSRPKKLIIAGLFGIVINDICYIIAFKYAPPVQAELIVCLWPMFVLILSAIFLKERITFIHIAVCCFAFCGVYNLLSADKDSDHFEWSYLIGYVSALISAIVWSIYILVSRRYKKVAPELFAFYCGAGVIIAAVIHFNCENTVIPEAKEGIVLFIMGISTHSLAYFGWDFAIKKGHFKLLSILPYANPVLAVLALIFCGFANFTEEIIATTIIIFISGVVIGMEGKNFPSTIIFYLYFRIQRLTLIRLVPVNLYNLKSASL